jgi:signal transduction histidine kinase
MVTLLTVSIFGLTVLLLTLGPRTTIREQIIARDRDVLQAATLMQQGTDELADPGTADGADEDPLDQLALVLETSKLKGVLAIRLFDNQGQQVASVPPGLRQTSLQGPDYELLRRFQPVSRYEPRADLAAVFEGESSAAKQLAPLLNVYVPVQRQKPKQLLAIAEFVMDGRAVADQFAALDRYLLQHGLLFFIFGSVIISAALAWAFKRLQRANEELGLRTTDLLRANHELTLSAKTSALGAVTAHLIHGLKNPLFGLQAFVSNARNAGDPPDESIWQAAAQTTQRMQEMISDIVRILQEQEAVGAYEVTFQELAEIVISKSSASASEAGVLLESVTEAQGTLSNYTANLIILILHNLLQNAVQASRRGAHVNLRVSEEAANVVCAVTDEGPGLPDAVRDKLFTVTRSNKTGGSGLGLAISKQLAVHLGADLEVAYSSSAGTRFLVSLPADRLNAVARNAKATALSC